MNRRVITNIVLIILDLMMLITFPFLQYLSRVVHFEISWLSLSAILWENILVFKIIASMCVMTIIFSNITNKITINIDNKNLLISLIFNILIFPLALITIYLKLTMLEPFLVFVVIIVDALALYFCFKYINTYFALYRNQ